MGNPRHPLARDTRACRVSRGSKKRSSHRRVVGLRHRGGAGPPAIRGSRTCRCRRRIAPHAGGRSDGRPRARLHPRRRRRIRPRRHRQRSRNRRVCAPPFVLLGDRDELLHGDRQDARRAPLVVEADPEGVQAEGQPLAVAAHALQTSGWTLTAQDVFNNVTRTASKRWPPRRATRSRCTPTRLTRRSRCRPTSRPASPATRSSSSSRRPAPAASSIRGAAATTSSGSPTSSRARLWAHIAGGRGTRRHGQGDRRRHPENAHRGGRRPHAGAHRQRRADDRRRQQVPRRRTRPRSTSSRSTTRPCASADRQTRAPARRARRQGRRERAQRAHQGGARGNGNLLELAVAAARAKATVGEISDAMEKVCGRHRAEIRAISGVYRRRQEP